MKILTSFYGKISFIFLLLLTALGIAQIAMTYNSSMQFIKQADQRLNVNLAKNMASEFAPLLKDSLDISLIKQSIHDMMVVNPRVEIYILDSEGEILAYFINPPYNIEKNRVDLQPIQDFIGNDYDRLLQGEDPRNPEISKPFSAARLALGPSDIGYLYVILGGEQYDSAMSMIQKNYFLQTSIKVFALILLITGVIGLILFAFLTKRLRAITTIIESFDKNSLDKRVPVYSKDEIGRLAQSFNRMADTLKENIKELEKTDHLRRELIANISHDLRSPLASIQGYLETIMIKDTSMDAKKRERYLEIILKNTSLLRQLVENLFELSKLESKQIEPDIELFSISDLVQDVTLKFEQKASKKGITLIPEAPSSLPLVKADIALIERVISNLIENAIQYTNNDGVVRISLEPSNKGVKILVSDSGVGIKEEDIPNIFNRFYRAEKSRPKDEGGTGLGLAIVKTILSLHGQDIHVTNKDSGGALFYFWLPSE